MSIRDTIFLLDGTDDLRQVEQTLYATEDLLQTVVERHTDEEQPGLRTRLLAVGFQVGGDFTLKLDLDVGGLARFEDAERTAWEVEAMLRAPGAEEGPVGGS